MCRFVPVCGCQHVCVCVCFVCVQLLMLLIKNSKFTYFMFTRHVDVDFLKTRELKGSASYCDVVPYLMKNSFIIILLKTIFWTFLIYRLFCCTFYKLHFIGLL